MLVKCDECNQEFDVKFKKRKFGRGLEETYFKCGNCYVHTTCFITNGKVRRLQKLMHAETIPDRKLEMLDEIGEIMDELLAKQGRR